MVTLRNITLWLAMAGVAIWLIFFNRPEPAPTALPSTNLPENSPDYYIEGLDLSRMDANGELVLTNQSASLAVYEDQNISIFTAPTVELYQQQVARWQIKSVSAELLNNDDIEFSTSVSIVQLNSDIPVTIHTEFLKISEQGQRISTDQPVEIIKGQQVTHAVGMVVTLNSPEPTIHLLSDVSFIYDPS